MESPSSSGDTGLITEPSGVDLQQSEIKNVHLIGNVLELLKMKKYKIVDGGIIFRGFEIDFEGKEILGYDFEGGIFCIYIKQFRIGDTASNLNPKIFVDLGRYRLFFNISREKFSQTQEKVFKCDLISILDKGIIKSSSGVLSLVRESLRLVLIEDHTVEEFINNYDDGFVIQDVLNALRSRVEWAISGKLNDTFDFILSDINDNGMGILVIKNNAFKENYEMFSQISGSVKIDLKVDGIPVEVPAHIAHKQDASNPKIVRIGLTYDSINQELLKLLRNFYRVSRYKLLHNKGCDISHSCKGSCATCN